MTLIKLIVIVIIIIMMGKLLLVVIISVVIGRLDLLPLPLLSTNITLSVNVGSASYVENIGITVLAAIDV